MYSHGKALLQLLASLDYDRIFCSGSTQFAAEIDTTRTTALPCPPTSPDSSDPEELTLQR